MQVEGRTAGHRAAEESRLLQSSFRIILNPAYPMEVLVKMKLSTLLGCSALVAASLCLAGNAAADTVLNGAVWTGVIQPNSYSKNGPFPDPIPLPTGYSGMTTPDNAGAGSQNPNITFNLTNSNTSNLFGMVTYTDGDLSQFLAGTNGNTVTYTNGSTDQGNIATNCLTGTTGSCGMNNDVMEFWGSTYLVNGQTYSFTKDDAMVLYIDGFATPLIDAQQPTSPDTLTSAPWAGATGTYNFNIWYDELNGAPGELQSPDFAVTPEPSSLLLLGTGLFALAFLLFRRPAKPNAVLNA